MKKTVLSAMLLCCLVLIMGCSSESQSVNKTAEASDYPTKEIKLYVPFSAGGTNDAAARIFGKYLSKYMDETVIVENKPGGGGLVQTTNFKNEENDGHYLQFTAEDPFTVQYALEEDSIEYELSDFDFLASPLSTPNMLVVPEGEGYDDIESIIDAADDNDKTLTFSSGGVGSINHFTGEAFFSELDIDIEHVPFEGGGEALNALLNGDVDMLVTAEGTILGQLEEGNIKVLANSTDVRSEFLDEVPTMQELGYDIDINAMFFVFAPKGMPEDIRNKITDSIDKVLDDSEFAKEVENLGLSLEDKKTDDEIKDYIEQTRETLDNIKID